LITNIHIFFLQRAFPAALVISFLATSGLAAPAGQGSTAGRPNVIVIFSDDQGYADLGLHNLRKDIKTPHLDALARSGVLFTEGYITSPQCTPSRAGLLTGRYQQRFGLDSISEAPLPLKEQTLAERLQRAGYATGMAGKWHLSMPGTVTLGTGETPEARAAELPFTPGARGFEDFFWGNWYDYWANYAPDGRALDREGEAVKYDHQKDENYYTDLKTEAALSFIRRQDQKPFFFYLPYLAPHTPLLATREYLDRFPGEMAERRRMALAMMSAIDDGVGRIMALLEEKGMRENTIIFYISDNGAPLGANLDQHLADIMPTHNPEGIWDGSLNEPLRGEKGMLSEGGIRVPFLMSWPAHVPAGTVLRQPVIALDVAPTVLAAAGLPADPGLDGMDLLPYVDGRGTAMPERDLFWRFWGQTAVRSGDWKLILAGDYKLLFNLKDDLGETKNVIGEQAGLAKALEKNLAAWNDEMKPPGIPRKPLNEQERKMYLYHFGDPESPDSPDVPGLPDGPPVEKTVAGE
jgi:arylsulfatase A-like enzyme